MNPEYMEAAVNKFILRVKKGLIYSTEHVWVSEGNRLARAKGSSEHF